MSDLDTSRCLHTQPGHNRQNPRQQFNPGQDRDQLAGQSEFSLQARQNLGPANDHPLVASSTH